MESVDNLAIIMEAAPRSRIFLGARQSGCLLLSQGWNPSELTSDRWPCMLVSPTAFHSQAMRCCCWGWVMARSEVYKDATVVLACSAVDTSSPRQVYCAGSIITRPFYAVDFLLELRRRWQRSGIRRRIKLPRLVVYGKEPRIPEEPSCVVSKRMPAGWSVAAAERRPELHRRMGLLQRGSGAGGGLPFLWCFPKNGQSMENRGALKLQPTGRQVSISNWSCPEVIQHSCPSQAAQKKGSLR